MDLLLDVESNDLIFTNGGCPVTDENRLIVAQRLTIRLQSFLGEWYFDTTYGVPYWQRILAKKTSKSSVDRIFQEQILAERGVLEILEFSSTLKNRLYEMSFRVRTNANQITDLIEINLGV